MSKLKIGIITLFDNNNYGNKLQNYALQQILSEHSNIVETFENTMDIVGYRYYDFNIMREFPLSVFSYIKYYLKKFLKKKNKDKDELKLTREGKISEFDKLIHKSQFYLKDENYSDIVQYYDYIVIGSDQIWNPSYTYSFDANFGTFIPKDKKISYAASFGIDKLNKNQIEFYEKALNNFKIENISVREEQGYKIIKRLIEKEVKVVLDPTMLLKKEEWTEVIKEPKKRPKKRFVLTYILGEVNKERYNFLDSFSKKYDYELINLMDKTTSEYTSGVEEFLWYFYNAEFIFADSFHAGVFSILFEKPFYILNREDKSANMNSRFDTLLKTFELEDRYLKSYNLEKVSFNIDYEKVRKILDRKRTNSFEFLSSALKRDKDLFY